MSMSDDPRGFRRGQGGGRDYAPRQGQGRSAPPAEDRYDPYHKAEPPAAPPRPQRPPPERPQPSFSAYKPEAFAKPDPAPQASDRPEWDAPVPRVAPPARGAPPPQDPYSPPSSPRDPYYSDAAGDPYAPRAPRSFEERAPRGADADRAPRGYDADWSRDPYQDVEPPQFPNYYSADEPQPGPDAQSMHDRFFAADANMDDVPPLPPARSGRLRDAFDDHDFDRTAPAGFDDEPPQSFSRKPISPYDADPDPRAPIGGFTPEPDARRHEGRSSGYDSDFDADQDQFYDWDKYDAPAPAAARPASPSVPMVMPEDDLDADFFADEDDYDADDYEPERSGGRKKLIAAVLTGAVVVGGGMAYVYKSATGDGGGGNPAVIAADTRPIKEEPVDAGGRDFANQDKLVYDRLPGYESGGGQSAGVSQEAGSSAAVVTTGTLEERIENALKSQGGETSPASRGGDSVDAPRPVQTLTFGPDGAQKPVETQTATVRAPASGAEPRDFSGGIVVTTTPSEEPSSFATSEQDAPAQDSQPESFSASAPEPQNTRLAAATPEPVTPEVTEGPAGTGGYFVQIGARNDRDAAVSAFETLQKKYASIIGTHSPSVRKADLGTKGVWYRLLIGPVTEKSEAEGLCEQLKGAGMKGCFARKD
jgi:cell division protein FtsN